MVYSDFTITVGRVSNKADKNTYKKSILEERSLFLRLFFWAGISCSHLSTMVD